jgi:para-aminobenzoate synthetase/4-amino-4-deoxychorismate lyase
LIKKDEVLLRVNNEWRHFSQAHCIISADRPGQVRDALQEVEQLVNDHRWHAAGFVSYEAAPAFDKSLQVIESNGFPLLWFGLYPEPQQIELPLPKKDSYLPKWMAATSQETHELAIATIKEQIAQGNTYQVNYTIRLKSDFKGDGFELFKILIQDQN